MAAEANEEKPINQQLEELWTQNGEKRGVPQGIRRLLNTAFTNVQVSSFPDLPSGKVVEIPGDSSIAQAVQTLAENDIFSAPVTNPEASPTDSWAARYKGMVDYPSIILWVLEQAEMAAAAFAAGSAAAVGMGAGAFGALGAIVLGLTGPVAIAGLATAAVGAAIAG
jgi:CBS domain-containing protein